MKKNLPPLFVSMLAGFFFLAGCSPVNVAGMAVGGTMYATQPSVPPPADLNLQMTPHESWCYRTLGDQTDCYPEPQATPPGRLVNVDPPNRYPLTPEAYREAVARSRARQAGLPDRPAEDLAKNPLDGGGVMDTQDSLPLSVEPTPILPIK